MFVIFFTITWLEMLYKQSNKSNLIWKIAYFKYQISGYFLTHTIFFIMHGLIFINWFIKSLFNFDVYRRLQINEYNTKNKTFNII